MPRSAYHCVGETCQPTDKILKQRETVSADLLGLEEILCVSDEHLLYARI